MMQKLCAVLSLALVACASKLTPPCDSEIYCYGPLLHTVQMNKIHDDSKTFVDMKMKQNSTITMNIFNEFMEEHNQNPSRDDVIRFVNDTFEPAGQEFQDWVPEDWNPSPAFIKQIKDKDYQQFARELNNIWKSLGRKMKDSIKEELDLYSIIWVPNPVIVPGGRFREFYYWDSYWIVQGLLLSEMHRTVKGMLENFAHIVENYGHIPNGGRIYYLARSQPPLFVPMVKSYLDYSKDFSFVEQNIGTLDKEFQYWMEKHSTVVNVDGKNYTLFKFGDFSDGPRPESYSEDVESAKFFKEDEQKNEYYAELRAAAESGWDFSSRWFIKNASNKNANLTDIKTRSIIPVDLNAIIYWNAVILSEFHETLKNDVKAKYYKEMAENIMEAVDAVLWHEEAGSWLDYDMLNDIKRDYFYPSNMVPLWTGCYNKANTEKIIRLVLKYLETNNVNYAGGIPTSKEHTGEQWDYPNAWAPLQHILIVGLNNTEDEAAKRLAFEIADKWVKSNYVAYLETEHMFEKYDATILGGHGVGGEYEVQLGFGWSNGVVMDLMYRYSDEISYQDVSKEEDNIISEAATDLFEPLPNNANTIGQIMTGFIALIVTLAAGYIG